MAVNINGELPADGTAKDVVLALIAKVGTGGGQGYMAEYRGTTIEKMSMEGRMTICNMSIEWGAKAGMIAPDQTTFDYLLGRPHAPQGAEWDAAMAYWQTLHTDSDAVFDVEVDIDAASLTPIVTWGTNPGQGVGLGESVPDPAEMTDAVARSAAERALEYMALTAGTPMREIKVDTVFLGSCTNGHRGLAAAGSSRAARSPTASAARVRLRHIRRRRWRGLDQVFRTPAPNGVAAAHVLGMNPDQLTPGERSASTSNRNFEGRQGKGGRTHLVSPAVAAATAITGHLSAPSDL